MEDSSSRFLKYLDPGIPERAEKRFYRSISTQWRNLDYKHGKRMRLLYFQETNPRSRILTTHSASQSP